MGAQGFCWGELPPPASKMIDLEGRIVKDGVGKTVRDRQLALNELSRGSGRGRCPRLEMI